MKKTAVRVLAAAAMAAAPMAVAIGVNPAVSQAIPDCGPGSWFDPNMSICRKVSDITNPQDCGPGNWWNPAVNACQPVVAPPPG